MVVALTVTSSVVLLPDFVVLVVKVKPFDVNSVFIFVIVRFSGRKFVKGSTVEMGVALKVKSSEVIPADLVVPFDVVKSACVESVLTFVVVEFAGGKFVKGSVVEMGLALKVKSSVVVLADVVVPFDVGKAACVDSVFATVEAWVVLKVKRL